MGNKIFTEADRKATPPAPATPNYTPHRDGGGQQVSRARGSHTNNKKNPGKRCHQGR